MPREWWGGRKIPTFVYTPAPKTIAVGPPTQPIDGSTSFLGVPPEIRNLIYDILIPGDIGIVDLSLLLTCRQIYLETQQRAYACLPLIARQVNPDLCSEIENPRQDEDIRRYEEQCWEKSEGRMVPYDLTAKSMKAPRSMEISGIVSVWHFDIGELRDLPSIITLRGDKPGENCLVLLFRYLFNHISSRDKPVETNICLRILQWSYTLTLGAKLNMCVKSHNVTKNRIVGRERWPRIHATARAVEWVDRRSYILVEKRKTLNLDMRWVSGGTRLVERCVISGYVRLDACAMARDDGEDCGRGKRWMYLELVL